MRRNPVAEPGRSLLAFALKEAQPKGEEVFMDRPEDRRYTRTEELYPDPAGGLDPVEARERVQANPEVLPPRPTARFRRTWANREILGMRALPLVILVVLGVTLPLFGSLMWKRRAGKGPSAARTTREKGVGRAKKEFAPGKKELGTSKKGPRAWGKGVFPFPDEGYPRFIVLASRPHGRAGKRARAVVLGKVEPGA